MADISSADSDGPGRSDTGVAPPAAVAELAGRGVVITGGANGLGLAYARAVVAAGGGVAILDADEAAAAAAIRELGKRHAVAVTGSVTSPDAVDSVLRLCEQRFGRVDGLVNNAAVGYECDPWDEEPGRLRRIVEVNVYGVLLCGAMASARMTAGGSIINVASGAAAGLARTSAYGATKGAVAAATYSWAIDLEPRGVRVNTLSPLAATALGRQATQTPVASTRRAGAIAPAVIWLLSDRSAGVTGQFLRFDGNSLRVVRHPGIKQRGISRESWDVTAIDAAMAELRDELEPYGLMPALPPVQRAEDNS